MINSKIPDAISNFILKNKTRLSVISFILFLATFTISLSSDLMHDASESRKQFEDMRKNVIFPQMIQWKKTLDNNLSDADLELLNSYRASAREIKDNISKIYASKDEANMDCIRSAAREQWQQMWSLARELKPLAEKYIGTIIPIAEEMSVKTLEWREAIHQLFKQSANSNCPSQISESGKCEFKARCGKSIVADKFGFCGIKKKLAMFMLWDGSEYESNQANRSADIAGLESQETLFNNYPNPFSERTTISFYLDNTENVKITLTDQSGNIITTVQKGVLKAGEHNIILDASKLSANMSAGTYLYKVESPSLNFTGKMVYQR